MSLFILGPPMRLSHSKIFIKKQPTVAVDESRLALQLFFLRWPVCLTSLHQPSLKLVNSPHIPADGEQLMPLRWWRDQLTSPPARGARYKHALPPVGLRRGGAGAATHRTRCPPHSPRSRRCCSRARRWRCRAWGPTRSPAGWPAARRLLGPGCPSLSEGSERQSGGRGIRQNGRASETAVRTTSSLCNTFLLSTCLLQFRPAVSDIRWGLR